MALPPGPRAPSLVTSARFLHRPLDRLRDWHAEFGDAFTIRFTGFAPGVYVADPDAIFAQAVAAGATPVFEVGEGHGWRLGRVSDPYGYHWEMGHPLE